MYPKVWRSNATVVVFSRGLGMTKVPGIYFSLVLHEGHGVAPLKLLLAFKIGGRADS